jgi:hypothetical protein
MSVLSGISKVLFHLLISKENQSSGIRAAICTRFNHLLVLLLVKIFNGTDDQALDGYSADFH